MGRLKRNLQLKNKTEKGYMLISTLSLLILSGLFIQAVIQISANQLIQLKQFSSAYEAKTALNMSEELFKEYISFNNESLPNKGNIDTSMGKIEISKIAKNNYQMTLTLLNGEQFCNEFKIDEETINKPEDENEEEIKNSENSKDEDDIEEELEQEEQTDEEDEQKEELKKEK